MGYHDLSECTLTADERRAEASRICAMLDDEIAFMQIHEGKFVEQISDDGVPVSVKQLFWLRDLKDKYL
jgi:hypothetical protein